MPPSAARPTRSASDLDAIDFYTRPGCGISAMLHRALTRRAIPMCVHDIWADDAAAARVRAAARGFETVPTVGIGSIILVNPRVRDVLAALAQHAPAIIVQEPPATGIWQRLRRARTKSESGSTTVAPPKDR